MCGSTSDLLPLSAGQAFRCGFPHTASRKITLLEAMGAGRQLLLVLGLSHYFPHVSLFVKTSLFTKQGWKK